MTLAIHSIAPGAIVSIVSLIRFCKPAKVGEPLIEIMVLFSVLLGPGLRWVLVSHCECQLAFLMKFTQLRLMTLRGCESVSVALGQYHVFVCVEGDSVA